MHLNYHKALLNKIQICRILHEHSVMYTYEYICHLLVDHVKGILTDILLNTFGNIHSYMYIAIVK